MKIKTGAVSKSKDNLSELFAAIRKTSFLSVCAVYIKMLRLVTKI